MEHALRVVLRTKLRLGTCPVGGYMLCDCPVGPGDQSEATCFASATVVGHRRTTGQACAPPVGSSRSPEQTCAPPVGSSRPPEQMCAPPD
eukprot:2929292-Prymnesium_polylepis.1